MKIAIIGVGAMGSVYAALLASGGHDVWAVDVWAEHIEAIRKNGLRLEGASGDRTVRIHATTDPADVRDVDLVIIATKHDGVAKAAQAALADGQARRADPHDPERPRQRRKGGRDRRREAHDDRRGRRLRRLDRRGPVTRITTAWSSSTSARWTAASRRVSRRSPRAGARAASKSRRSTTSTR